MRVVPLVPQPEHDTAEDGLHLVCLPLDHVDDGVVNLHVTGRFDVADDEVAFLGFGLGETADGFAGDVDADVLTAPLAGQPIHLS